MASAAQAPTTAAPASTMEQVKKAASRALGGGIAGAAAMAVQVVSERRRRFVSHPGCSLGTRRGFGRGPLPHPITRVECGISAAYPRMLPTAPAPSSLCPLRHPPRSLTLTLTYQALLMPLRTIMNSQYRHGKSLRDVGQRLWSEGGVRRFYRCVVLTNELGAGGCPSRRPTTITCWTCVE